MGSGVIERHERIRMENEGAMRLVLVGDNTLFGLGLVFKLER